MSTDIITINDLAIGQTISFKTYNQYDKVEWKGLIVGFGNYSLVSKLEDLLPYYQNVKKTQSNMADISELNYIIFDMYENITAETTNKRVIAKEWIDQSTLRLIDIHKTLDIRIFNVGEADSTKIIDILGDHGYSCSVLS